MAKNSKKIQAEKLKKLLQSLHQSFLDLSKQLKGKSVDVSVLSSKLEEANKQLSSFNVFLQILDDGKDRQTRPTMVNNHINLLENYSSKIIKLSSNILLNLAEKEKSQPLLSPYRERLLDNAKSLQKHMVSLARKDKITSNTLNIKAEPTKIEAVPNNFISIDSDASLSDEEYYPAFAYSNNEVKQRQYVSNYTIDSSDDDIYRHVDEIIEEESDIDNDSSFYDSSFSDGEEYEDKDNIIMTEMKSSGEHAAKSAIQQESNLIGDDLNDEIKVENSVSIPVDSVLSEKITGFLDDLFLAKDDEVKQIQLVEYFTTELLQDDNFKDYSEQIQAAPDSYLAHLKSHDLHEQITILETQLQCLNELIETFSQDDDIVWDASKQNQKNQKVSMIKRLFEGLTAKREELILDSFHSNIPYYIQKLVNEYENNKRITAQAGELIELFNDQFKNKDSQVIDELLKNENWSWLQLSYYADGLDKLANAYLHTKTCAITQFKKLENPSKSQKEDFKRNLTHIHQKITFFRQLAERTRTVEKELDNEGKIQKPFITKRFLYNLATTVELKGKYEPLTNKHRLALGIFGGGLILGGGFFVAAGIVGIVALGLPAIPVIVGLGIAAGGLAVAPKLVADTAKGVVKVIKKVANLVFNKIPDVLATGIGLKQHDEPLTKKTRAAGIALEVLGGAGLLTAVAGGGALAIVMAVPKMIGVIGGIAAGAIAAFAPAGLKKLFGGQPKPTPLAVEASTPIEETVKQHSEQMSFEQKQEETASLINTISSQESEHTPYSSITKQKINLKSTASTTINIVDENTDKKQFNHGSRSLPLENHFPKTNLFGSGYRDYLNKTIEQNKNEEIEKINLHAAPGIISGPVK